MVRRAEPYFFFGAFRAAPCIYLDPRGLATASVTRRHSLGFLVSENEEINRDSMTTAIANSTALASAAALERGDNHRPTAFIRPPHLPPSIS